MNAQRNKLARGFTLVEMMIAMALGLLLVAGAIHIMLGAQQSYRMQDNVARIQENGRFAIEFLARDLRRTGFMHCGSAESMDVFNNVKGSGNNADSTYDFSAEELIRGTAPAGAAADSDAVRVRYLSDQRLRVLEVSQGQGQQGANIKVAGNALGLQQGDVVTVTNCREGDTFRITNTPQKDADGSVMVTLAHAANYNLSPHLNGSYGDGDHVLAYRALTWFVAETGRHYDDGTVVRALFRDSRNGAEEMVAGVRRMRIRYGVDDSGDGAADRYAHADDGVDWSRVVSARVSVLLESRDDRLVDRPQELIFDNTLLTMPDRRLYRVFTTTVALRNRVGRDI